MPTLYYKEDGDWTPLNIGSEVVSKRVRIPNTNFSCNFDEPFAGVPRVVAMAVGTQEIAITSVSESGFVVNIQSGSAPCDIMYLAAYTSTPYDNYTGEELLDNHMDTCKTVLAAAQRVADYFSYRFETMSWAYMSKMSQVAAAQPAAFGNYIGRSRVVDMGRFGGNTTFEVVGINHDTNSSGTGAITFLADKCITQRIMNNSGYTSGGWESCDMRFFLSGTVLSVMPSDLRAVIATVNKVNTPNYGTSPTQDKLWIPSYTEVGFGGNEGTAYSTLNSNSARIRNYNNRAGYWWLRSVKSSRYFECVDTEGSLANITSYPSNAYGVVPGFCI